MNETTRQQLNEIYSTERQTQNQAYTALLAETERPVSWGGEAWGELLAALRHPDNHVRSIAGQLLSHLALSVPEESALRDFDALLNGTRDERFVTARHTLQAIWRVGLAGPAQRQRAANGLAARFADCAAEKNVTLIRSDILQDFRWLHEATGDDSLRQLALELIEAEPDEKLRKKYAAVWRVKRAAV